MSHPITFAADVPGLRALRAHLQSLYKIAERIERLNPSGPAMMPTDVADDVYAEAVRLAAVRVAVPVRCCVCFAGCLEIVTVGDRERAEPDLEWHQCGCALW